MEIEKIGWQNLRSFLLDDAVAVGIEEFLQVGNLLFEQCAFVCVGDEHASVGHFDDLCGALDVGASLDGIGGAAEGLVLYELESSAVIDQRVACNACLFVVGL